MKEVSVIIFCTWKFALTFPYAIYGVRMSFWETIFFTNIGGLIGLVVSVFLSRGIILVWEKYVHLNFRRKGPREKNRFTRRNRFLVKLKTQYGFPGIVILTPILLSIPVGSFLMTKYYGVKFRNVFWLLAGQVGWSFIYTIFYMYLYFLFTQEPISF
jgi:hypothetical protein